MKSRSSVETWNGWMSICEDQPPALVRIVIKEAWSAILPILILLEGHHLFGYVHLRWITHPYHVQRQQSRYSRRSSDRVRTSSDPLPLEENRLPQVSFDLLQLPPGNAHAHSGGRFSDLLVSSDDCKPLMNLRRFSASLQVGQGLLAQANPTCLLGYSSPLLKSAS